MTKDEALDKALEAAYLAGFNASGEGYNGEYPFRDHGAHPEQDAGWIKNRDSELNAIKQARSAPVQEPVGWFKYDKVSGCWHPQHDEFAPTHAVREGWKQLYTTPPAQPAPVQEPIGYWPVERDGVYNSRDSVTAYRTPKAGWMPVYTTPPAQPAPVPLTDGVNVPLTILEAAEASLGSFCSDHGWSDKDMQNMDNLSAYIAQHKAAHVIK